MNTHHHPYLPFALIVCASAMLGPVSSRADFAFHVDVNTASLIGHPDAPFALDFQLTDGSGLLAGPNTVTLSNFTFVGGGATGTPPISLFGGALGNLGSTVTLSNSANFLSEFYQGFAPGTTLGFDVSLTTLLDASPTPDAFSFSILDNSLGQIPTSDPLGVSLLVFDITSASPSLGSVKLYNSVAPVPGVTVSVSPIVPEPGTIGFGLALLSVLAVRRARSTRRQTREQLA